MGIDLTDSKFLKNVAGELESSENLERKRRSYISYDIYNNNQHQYVEGCLSKDYPKESFDAMRKITSINFAKRIVDVEASVYKFPAQRMFGSNNDDVVGLLENIYHYAKVDYNNKQLNRFYRLDEQCASLIVPNKRLGIIGKRKLQNWQYDVIPDPDWPDQALAYIIPMLTKPGQYVDTNYYANDPQSDNVNQRIADRDDKKPSSTQYILWSDEYNFMFKSNGEIITPKDERANPIGMMPITDVSMPKQNSFMLQNDNNLARFTVDFLCMLSDLAEIIRMQGYSQSILSALEKPESIFTGPHRLMFLQKKKNADAGEQPEFSFATPNPDLQGALDGLLAILRMQLSSRGHKTNVVTGGQNVDSFASGLERLLAQIEQHSSSIDDFSLFNDVEHREFEIFRRTSNYLNSGGAPEGFELINDLQGPEIPEDTEFNIRFHEPQMIETEADKQARLGERLENRTLGRVKYIMELDGVTEEVAKQIAEEADTDAFGTAEDI